MQNHANEAHLSALIDSTEDYIWSVDLDYRMVAFNRATTQSFQDHFGKPLSLGKRHDEQAASLPRPSSPWGTPWDFP